MTKNGVVLASGGLDSTTAAYLYEDKGYALHLVGMDYGQRHARRELKALRDVAASLGASVEVADLRGLQSVLGGSALTADAAVPDGHYEQESMRATVVPNRNAIMLSVAAAVAIRERAEVLVTGIHAGDHYIYPDCRPAFFEPFAMAIAAGTEGHAAPGFHLAAPFLHKSKADIVRLGAKLGVPYDLTWSCYKGQAVHCGACGTCFERREAFDLAEVPDPTIYAERPIYQTPERA